MGIADDMPQPEMNNKIYSAANDRPIDSNAARVLSRGEHWSPSNKMGAMQFEVPPGMADLSRGRNETQPEDMTGRKIGRMVVIGYFGKGKKRGGAQRWVCRCPCGVYAIRTAGAIKKAKNPDEKCGNCQEIERLRNSDRWRHGLES